MMTSLDANRASSLCLTIASSIGNPISSSPHFLQCFFRAVDKSPRGLILRLRPFLPDNFPPLQPACPILCERLVNCSDLLIGVSPHIFPVDYLYISSFMVRLSLPNEHNSLESIPFNRNFGLHSRRPHVAHSITAYSLELLAYNDAFLPWTAKLADRDTLSFMVGDYRILWVVFRAKLPTHWLVTSCRYVYSGFLNDWLAHIWYETSQGLDS
ncbi:hypothetical protein GYMLUDRAFT_777592 [Collybiopsis luxurians FD-317 M1]|uniref:Uncharacterized protein n=1 Tax=Collybiopsis luxurians FD-317 M1 TaxID=944289 RepID=A0A0D0BPH4_9AGAR|nr:hypothetical protein GYMLUDRAFT_777592 [Collybiopsis luxurians FD-317 M1]